MFLKVVGGLFLFINYIYNWREAFPVCRYLRQNLIIEKKIVNFIEKAIILLKQNYVKLPR